MPKKTMHQHKWEIALRRAIREKLTAKSLAAEMDVAVNTVRYYETVTGIRLTRKKTSETRGAKPKVDWTTVLTAARAENLIQRQVAQMLGMSESSVQLAQRKTGITLPKLAEIPSAALNETAIDLPEKALRRTWTNRQKLALLQEAAQPNVTAKTVAQKYDLRPDLLLKWRREAADGKF